MSAQGGDQDIPEDLFADIPPLDQIPVLVLEAPGSQSAPDVAGSPVSLFQDTPGEEQALDDDQIAAMLYGNQEDLSVDDFLRFFPDVSEEVPDVPSNPWDHLAEPNLKNVVAGYRIRDTTATTPKIDLYRLAILMRNSEVTKSNLKGREVDQLVAAFRHPAATLSLKSGGSLDVLGTKTVDDSIHAATKFVSAMNIIDMDPNSPMPAPKYELDTTAPPKLKNAIFTTRLRVPAKASRSYGIDLQGLAARAKAKDMLLRIQKIQADKADVSVWLFPFGKGDGTEKKRIKANVFSSGGISLTGGKYNAGSLSLQQSADNALKDAREAMEAIFPLLWLSKRN